MKIHKSKFLVLFTAFIIIINSVPIPTLANKLSVWDGKTIDVSWYNDINTEFYINTPAQLMGLAAIVNGIYNSNITTIIGDKSVIKDNQDTKESGGLNKSTPTYHYGGDDFNNKTIYLTDDLDMGGVYDTDLGTWNGPNFMPIGGQYLMNKNDSTTKLSSSFCGTLDGQGHTIYNIYCERQCSSGNYGDGESVGVIGRLGVHDNDPADIRPVNPTVRNLAVTGYIFANRSVGGIVGKIGKTSFNNGDESTGGVIENCANFATVSNTDAKGCGGIVGAGWNGGVVRNCYNAGSISTTYVCPTGGISGSNEILLVNCYSVGSIKAVKDNYAMGIGTNNGGAPYKIAIDNCYYLEKSATGGGYYSSGTVYDDGVMTTEKMKSEDFVTLLGDAFIKDENCINKGYPILRWQKNIRTPIFSSYNDVSVTAWYFDAVSYVISKGLFDMVGEKTFCPELPMTRAMLVTALYHLEENPEVTINNGFTDIPEDTNYSSAVQWAYENNIVNGLNDEKFNPGGSITREQIAAMLYRYAAFKKENIEANGDISIFSDSETISEYARISLSWAVGKGLISGMGNGTVEPQGTATRAQVAIILKRFVESNE